MRAFYLKLFTHDVFVFIYGLCHCNANHRKNNNIEDTYPTVTSNMLLPTELETAMSPKPFRATITDVIKSGIEVPAAKNVKPIT